MKSTIEPLEGNRVKLRVHLDEDEFEPALDDAFRQLAREVRIPGFRPGKAPRRVLEARLGPGVARGQALQDAIPDYYARAVREHDVDVIESPEIDITEGRDDGAVAFEATVQVRPEITLSGYGNLRVEVPSPIPDDEEVDDQIERLRQSHSTLSGVERSAIDGDVVRIDIAGSIDGEPAPGLTSEDYSYEVGAGAIVDEIDEQLRGASVGDILEFDARHPQQDDVELHFRILVKEVSERVLPAVDDAFAAEVSEFSSLEELRGDLRERTARSRRAQARSVFQQRVGEALAALVDDEIPDALVANELRQRIQSISMRLQAQGIDIETWLQMQGRSTEDFVAEMREAAAVDAALDLALRAVAEAEGVEVTDDDLDEEFRAVAERIDATPEEVRDRFERSEQVQAIRSDLRKQKAFTWLLGRVEVVDEDGEPVDRELLLAEEDDDAGGGDGGVTSAGGTGDPPAGSTSEHGPDTSGHRPDNGEDEQ